MSYGNPTRPSERNVTIRARRAFTPAVPLGLAQRMDRSPREHQPEAPRASPAVVRKQLAPRPHARGPQRRRRVSAARTAYYLLPHAVRPALYEPRTQPRPLDAPREAILRLAESWAGPPRPARYRRKIGCVSTPIAGASGILRVLPVLISSSTCPEASLASGRLKIAPNEARSLASR